MRLSAFLILCPCRVRPNIKGFGQNTFMNTPIPSDQKSAFLLGVFTALNFDDSLVSYLIVGSIPDPVWKYGNYGTKVRSAIDLKRSGHELLIVSEDSFAALIK